MEEEGEEYDEQGEYDEDLNDQEDNDYYEEEEEVEIVSADIISSSAEKNMIFRRLNELRIDGSYCDVALLCKGSVFKAHKVVLSSWSRWLRSLLMDNPEEEVLSLDIFTPDALSSVLDYMYGVTIVISVETADELMKAVRRLELKELEQQCWKYLMAVVSLDNCELMHALADRYDCPPLKLAAFRALKERDPSYALPPERLTAGYDWNFFQKNPCSFDTGFTGPGELHFNEAVKLSEDQPQFSYFDVEDDALDGGIPSILEFTHPQDASEVDTTEGKEKGKEKGTEEDDAEAEAEDENGSMNDDQDGEESENDKISTGKKNGKQDIDNSSPVYCHPKDLPITASARDVVTCWAHRLQEIYVTCVVPSLEVLEEENMMATRLEKDGIPSKDDEGDENSENKEHRRGLLPPSAMMPSNTGLLRYHYSPKRSKTPWASGGPALNLSQASLSMHQKSHHNGTPSHVSRGHQMIDWPRELKQFYLEINLPEKISDIGDILKVYKGKEDQMIWSLMSKYSKSVTPSLRAHLQALINLAETGTEASFNQEKQEKRGLGGGGGGREGSRNGARIGGRGRPVVDDIDSLNESC